MVNNHVFLPPILLSACSTFHFLFWILFYAIFSIHWRWISEWKLWKKKRKQHTHTHTHCVAFTLIIEPLLRFLVSFFQRFSLNPCSSNRTESSLFLSRKRWMLFAWIAPFEWWFFIHSEIQNSFQCEACIHIEQHKSFFDSTYIYISIDNEYNLINLINLLSSGHTKSQCQWYTYIYVVAFILMNERKRNRPECVCSINLIKWDQM